MKINHKSFLVIISIFILLGLSAYYVYSKSAAASLAEYKSTKYNFSFSYSPEWKVEDYGGPGPDGVIVTDPATKDSVYISYNERLEAASMSAPAEKRQNLREAIGYDLSDIREIPIAGGVGYEGTFSNKVINFTETQIWMEHNGHIYVIAFSKNNNGSNVNNSKRELNDSDNNFIKSFKWLN